MYDAGAPPCDTGMLSMGLPVLGICYGLQWMTHNLGGRVERADRREYGRTELLVKDGSPLFAGLPKKLRIWNSHGDHVRALPAGFHVTGETGNAVSAAEDPARKLYAVQFHPGSAAHRLRLGNSAQFCLRYLPRAAAVERRGIHRRNRGIDSQASGRRPGDLRAERRSGFRRGRGASCTAPSATASRIFL